MVGLIHVFLTLDDHSLPLAAVGESEAFPEAELGDPLDLIVTDTRVYSPQHGIVDLMPLQRLVLLFLFEFGVSLLLLDFDNLLTGFELCSPLQIRETIFFPMNVVVSKINLRREHRRETDVALLASPASANEMLTFDLGRFVALTAPCHVFIGQCRTRSSQIVPIHLQLGSFGNFDDDSLVFLFESEVSDGVTTLDIRIFYFMVDQFLHFFDVFFQLIHLSRLLNL